MDTHPRLAGPSRLPLIAAIVAILMVTSALFSYMRMQRVKAETARQDQMTAALTLLRGEIDTFRKQHGRFPHALSELPQVPRDPVTGSQTTWQTETEESVSVDDFTAKSTRPEVFIVNVRSGAKGRDAHGRAWSDY